MMGAQVEGKGSGHNEIRQTKNTGIAGRGHSVSSTGTAVCLLRFPLWNPAGK